MLRVVGDVTAAHATVAASATRLVTLEDVLRWGGDVLDVVIQDEYTHDVIVRKGAYLVFDTT